MQGYIEQIRTAMERQRAREQELAEVQQDLAVAAQYVSYWQLLDREDRLVTIDQLRQAAKRLLALADTLAR